MERPSGGIQAIKKAAELLSECKISSYFIWCRSNSWLMQLDDCKALAEKLDAPVACGYQHNDSFPGSHPLL